MTQVEGTLLGCWLARWKLKLVVKELTTAPDTHSGGMELTGALFCYRHHCNMFDTRLKADTLAQCGVPISHSFTIIRSLQKLTNHLCGGSPPREKLNLIEFNLR